MVVLTPQPSHSLIQSNTSTRKASSTVTSNTTTSYSVYPLKREESISSTLACQNLGAIHPLYNTYRLDSTEAYAVPLPSRVSQSIYTTVRILSLSVRLYEVIKAHDLDKVHLVETISSRSHTLLLGFSVDLYRGTTRMMKTTSSS